MMYLLTSLPLVRNDHRRHYWRFMFTGIGTENGGTDKCHDISVTFVNSAPDNFPSSITMQILFSPKLLRNIWIKLVQFSYVNIFWKLMDRETSFDWCPGLVKSLKETWMTIRFRSVCGIYHELTEPSTLSFCFTQWMQQKVKRRTQKAYVERYYSLYRAREKSSSSTLVDVNENGAIGSFIFYINLL